MDLVGSINDLIVQYHDALPVNIVHPASDDVLRRAAFMKAVENIVEPDKNNTTAIKAAYEVYAQHEAPLTKLLRRIELGESSYFITRYRIFAKEVLAKYLPVALVVGVAAFMMSAIDFKNTKST